jgi:hypothetical protein
MRNALLFGLVALLLVGCGGGKQVTRIETDSTTDLSGRWNDTDSRLVAEEMIADALARPWLVNFISEQGHKPVVTVGTIRNLTQEHISIETMVSDFERSLINAGTVRFIASQEAREEIRGEREEQQQFATPETAKKMRAELGADFVLQGAVKQIVDQEGKAQTSFYQADFELVNLETLEKVWIGTKEIKKGISQGSRKW